MEGETWMEYPAHNIGGRSNPPEEGYMSLPDAYDHLVFYYLQCGDMERAWELRSERIEYTGNPDLLNGYIRTLGDGSTTNYDAYGRKIGFVNPDGDNQEYVFEIGNRPVEVFVNGESRFKYYYDEDGRCIRVERERDHGEEITTYTYLEDGVLLEEWAYLDRTPRLKYYTIDKYGYLHAMEQPDTE